MATTFQDLYTDVLERGHLKSDDTLALPMVKRWLNQRYQQVARAKSWRWLMKRAPLSLAGKYATGVVNVTKNSTSVTAGSDPPSFTTAMAGRRFKAAGFREVYTIAAVPDASTLTLAAPFQGESVTDAAYLIVQTDYDLPGDFDRLADPYRSFSPLSLEPMGLREMNSLWGFDAAYGTPTHYTLVDEASSGTTQLRIHPAAAEAQTLYIDYLVQVPPLSNDGDEALIPEAYRDVLIWGALADLSLFKDDNRAERMEVLFARRLAEMASDYAITDDVVRTRPADHYRSHFGKR